MSYFSCSEKFMFLLLVIRDRLILLEDNFLPESVENFPRMRHTEPKLKSLLLENSLEGGNTAVKLESVTILGLSSFK